MIEKLNQLAEHAATNVSRRQFLGRFGRGALMTAAALGAFVALPREAQAGRRCPPGYRWCQTSAHGPECIPRGEHCPKCKKRQDC